MQDTVPVCPASAGDRIPHCHERIIHTFFCILAVTRDPVRGLKAHRAELFPDDRECLLIPLIQHCNDLTVILYRLTHHCLSNR